MANLKANLRNFESAEKFLNGKSAKVLGHNTTVVYSGNWIGVWLHSTEIVRYWKDGRIWATNGGYGTVTTRDRLNQLVPGVTFFQKNWVQKVHYGPVGRYPEYWDNGETHDFYGTVSFTFDSDGNVDDFCHIS